MQLHKLVFTKEMLEKVPDCQRAVLVYAGHISNELNWLNKISFILQTTGSPIAKKLPCVLSPQEEAILGGNATQTFIHLRLCAGKIHEAVNFLERWCFDMPWFVDACTEMADDGKQALSKIQTHLSQIKDGSKSNLMRLVRNKFGFHYDEKAVKNSIRVADLVEDFTTYLVQNVGNTLYLGSEYAVSQQLIEMAKQGDARKTIENLMDDVLDLSRNINTLLGHTLSHLCFKFFGEELQTGTGQETIDLETEPLEQLRLPFFTTPPAASENAAD